MSVIRIAAVVIRNAGGDILSVRKRGTVAFMLPGGKLEAGETGRQTAVREISEELGVDLDPELLVPLGRFGAPAANEAGCSVDCDVFLHPDPVDQLPEVRAEIEEARFFRADSDDPVLAPLSRDVVFPAVAGSVGGGVGGGVPAPE
ncbi:NUDIX domain-containing protein [Corynebacterium sp. P7003]|uniref:NUDIX domain-containing protein n=1 Tax=Corynebacterium pygosceleis TaxID=2800406 RepID=A0ABT3WQF0_9CORY|nr:NUDIX domain-containing protein [Corynebacterium pygosceleis]MCX7444447.1 NUDIX domain-containing protein [Corynebacterium pygosceleis]